MIPGRQTEALCSHWDQQCVGTPGCVASTPYGSIATVRKRYLGRRERSIRFIANFQAYFQLLPWFPPTPVKLPFNCMKDLLSMQGKHFHLEEGVINFPRLWELNLLFWLQKEPDPPDTLLRRKDIFFWKLSWSWNPPWMLIQSMSGNSFSAEVKLESYLNNTIIWRNHIDLLFAEIFVLLDKCFMLLPIMTPILV